MFRKQYGTLIAVALLPALAGCVQATRHSNTMVFGTNTTVGVKVGQDVNQMPQVLIAYDRQEVVIMPLLANVSETEGASNSLSPCDPTASVTTNGTGDSQSTTSTYTNAPTNEVHPCKFVAIREGANNLRIQDSYSVLASFGANIEGDSSGQTASVGLAQFFATGAAAQTLAMTGGASVVSVGDAAEASAANTTAPAAAASALGGEPGLASITASCGTINPDTVALNQRFRNLVGTIDGQNSQIRQAAAESLEIEVPPGTVPTWPVLRNAFDQKLCDDSRKKAFLDELEQSAP